MATGGPASGGWVEMELADEVQVDVDKGRLARVRIPTRWNKVASVADLSAALSSAVTAALPPVVETSFAAQESSVRPDLTVEQLAEYMARQREWRAALTDVQRRARAGEFSDDQPSEVVDPGQKVSITFAGGRFEAIHLRPDWAEHAPAQAISDAILDATATLDLVRPDRYSAALTHVEDLDAGIRRFAR